jgi:hypothetical protein
MNIIKKEKEKKSGHTHKKKKKKCKVSWGNMCSGGKQMIDHKISIL